MSKIVIEVEVDGAVMVPVDDDLGIPLRKVCANACAQVQGLLNSGKFGFSGKIAGKTIRCEAAPESWQEERASLLKEVELLRLSFNKLRFAYCQKLGQTGNQAWGEAIGMLDHKFGQIARSDIG